ncbi:hypothetical protein ACFL59_12855 [Planctomycetota bacterium]
MGRAKALLVRLSLIEHAQINELAEQEQCSYAEMVRRAVAAYAQRRQEHEGGAVRDRAGLERRLELLEQAHERHQDGIRRLCEEVERLGRKVGVGAAAPTTWSSGPGAVAVEPCESVSPEAGGQRTEGRARAHTARGATTRARSGQATPMSPAGRGPKKKRSPTGRRAAAQPTTEKAATKKATTKKAATQKATTRRANRSKAASTVTAAKRSRTKRKKAAAKKTAAKRTQRT